MSVYPPKVEELFRRPKHSGTPSEEAAAGTAVSLECGVSVKFFIIVEDAAETIRSVSYRTSGCGFTIAAAEALAEDLTGKELKSLGGFEPAAALAVVEAWLGTFPLRRGHCAAVVVDALRESLADHRRRRLEEFQGEKAVICTCFGVSEETIATLIRQNDITDTSEVAALSKAGSGCGACRMLIREMIESRHLD